MNRNRMVLQTAPSEQKHHAFTSFRIYLRSTQRSNKEYVKLDSIVRGKQACRRHSYRWRSEEPRGESSHE